MVVRSGLKIRIAGRLEKRGFVIVVVVWRGRRKKALME